MGEHTPVGWKQSERWESWIVTDDDEEMLIAQVNWSGATLTLAQWHAHARLLAAAPDLLAACEAAKEALIVTAVYPDEMREQLETGEIERRMRAIGEEEFDPKRRVRTLLAINAVIAKAKGES